MDEFTRKSTQHMDQKLVKQAIKAIDKSPELKKIRSINNGTSCNLDILPIRLMIGLILENYLIKLINFPK